MKNRLRLLVILLLVILISLYLPTPYHLVKPGVALPLRDNIFIAGETYPKKGDFLLTAVATERASVFELFHYFLSSPKEMDLVRIDTRLPEGVDMQEYVNLMAELMEESKLKAKVVALNRVGEEAEVTGEGAQVVDILEGSRAKDLLEPGDIIFSAGDRRISLATELVQLLDEKKIGEDLALGVKRGEEHLYFSVATREFPDRPDKPSIGILIRSYALDYHFSREIQIQTQRIIGPSAGLMFSLEIINQLIPEDITRGLQIAGTGTIDLEGNIGPIDGVVQKIYSAQKKGAQAFVLPEKNRQDLDGHQFSIQIIVVDTIDELLTLFQDDGSFSEVLSWKAFFFSAVEEAV